jgi:hypothetical protein
MSPMYDMVNGIAGEYVACGGGCSCTHLKIDEESRGVKNIEMCMSCENGHGHFTCIVFVLKLVLHMSNINLHTCVSLVVKIWVCVEICVDNSYVHSHHIHTTHM